MKTLEALISHSDIPSFVIPDNTALQEDEKVIGRVQFCGHTSKNIMVHDHSRWIDRHLHGVSRSGKYVSDDTSLAMRPYNRKRDGKIIEWFEEGADVTKRVDLIKGLKATHNHDGKGLNGAIEFITK